MVAELSAVGQTVSALTGMDGLPVIIVQCVVTTLYTCKYQDETIGDNLLTSSALGGFKVSFFTDNIQGAMVVGLSMNAFYPH